MSIYFNGIELVVGGIGKERVMTDMDAFRKQLEGYSLTTANILYRLPDHKSILQNFIWQKYDIHPKFPELRKFLDFWDREIEGPIHSVYVAHTQLITPAEIRFVGSEYRLH